MKKTTLLTIVAFCFSASDAESNQQSKASNETQLTHEVAYASWFNQLNQHLIGTKNSYFNAMGIASTLNATLSLPENAQTDIDILLPPQVNVMNELIARNDLTNEILDLLVTWCFKPSIKDLCDQQTLLDKHLEQQPENLHVYFQPIQIALQQNNSELVTQTLLLMANSTHNQYTHYITPEFNEKIDTYIEEAPLPANYIQAMIDDSNFNDAIQHLDAQQQQQHIKQFITTAIKMSYAMLYSPPQVEPLYRLCKTNQEFLEQCAAITQVLINHSNSLNAKGLGYAMLMGIHESRGQTKFLEVVADKQERYRQQLQCLSKATQSKTPINDFLDPKYQAIQLKAIDENDKIKELAMYVYSKYKDSNPEQINPESCYQEL